MTDAEPFKDEGDGLDESLVPHDSGTAGVFDISDDEIYVLSSELAKHSGHVTFIFDSCHSGDAMKGVGKKRAIRDVAKSPSRPLLRRSGRRHDSRATRGRPQ